MTFRSRLGLLAATALLCSAAVAPFGQFYLAWIGLAPWLLALRDVRSMRRAFAVGWLGGVIFFGITMHWLWRATIPGTIGVSCYLALFWGFAAAVMIGSGLLDPSAHRSGARTAVAALLIAATWASSEWLRGYVFGGFPWAFVSHTQTPLVTMCQIADITGSYGIAFWVMLVNATLYFTLTSHPRRNVIPAAAVCVAVVGVVAIYGIFRIHQTHTRPGPVVMVVQPNFPHARGGAQTVTQEQQIEFHLNTTREALKQSHADLVVWSETVMPGLNPETRDEPGLAAVPFLRRTHQLLVDLAASQSTALLTGGYYVGGWQGTLGKRRATDIRNSVYLFDRTGQQGVARYDKIHLVPFAEFLPFRTSAPPIYRILRWFAAYSVDYPIIAADPDALTVFSFDVPATSEQPGATYRVVTPICFEDTNAALVARMFRPGADGAKRAHFIANITNDGWFRGVQQAQHLQSAVLRSIENRAPTARSANTGISGFIDSCGRAVNLLPVRTAGTAQLRIPLDDRITFYTRFGDVFGLACTVATLGVGLHALGRRWRLRADQKITATKHSNHQDAVDS
jgi:apolipoprotein N-acyltransferase